jgi:hypothetical protein
MVASHLPVLPAKRYAKGNLGTDAKSETNPAGAKTVMLYLAE